MCEQCLANMTHYVSIGGICFGRVETELPKNFRQDVVPQGWWGLIFCNDPEFYFRIPDGSLVGDGVEDNIDYWNAYEDFLAVFKLPVRDGYELYAKCLSLGYDPKAEEATSVEFWLWSQLLERIHKQEFDVSEDEDNDSI